MKRVAPLNQTIQTAACQSFLGLNHTLSSTTGLGQNFSIHHTNIIDSKNWSTADIFSQQSGTYIISCHLLSGSNDRTYHYVVYHAGYLHFSWYLELLFICTWHFTFFTGTRVLQLYPEVLVLYDVDVCDVIKFAHRLRSEVYNIYIETKPGSMRANVRQVYLNTCDPRVPKRISAAQAIIARADYALAV